MKLYAIGLALLSEEDRQATLRWAVFERRERSSFMPTLPELLTYARRRHAERAWSAVIDSVYKHNVWEPKRRPKLGEAAAYALVMIGGWDVACDDQEDRRRLHRDFIDAYLRWQPELGDFSKCL